MIDHESLKDSADFSVENQVVTSCSATNIDIGNEKIDAVIHVTTPS